MTAGADAAPSTGPRLASLWKPYRTELLLFAAAFLALASFSGPRFLRQSAAPHFIYQAKAFLDGRLDLDPQTLPNIGTGPVSGRTAGSGRGAPGRSAPPTAGTSASRPFRQW